MKSFPSTFCIIDTETTGMRASLSRIMDIGIIRIENGKVVETYETFLNPNCHIPYSISLITGITTKDVAGAPCFEDIAHELKDILRDAVFVAHNVTFDYSFIQEEFKRVGIDYSAPKLCSVRLSRALFPEEKRHNLDALIERFGLSIKKRHRALPDAKAVLQFFKRLEKVCDKEKLKEAISRLISYPTHDLEMIPVAEMEKEEGVIYIS